MDRSAEVLRIFVENNVDCIRIGLCESDNLHSDSSFVAGPNHPSIGEMIKSELYLKLIEESLSKSNDKTLVISCSKGATSQIIGNKAKNKNYLKKKSETILNLEGSMKNIIKIFLITMKDALNQNKSI